MPIDSFRPLILGAVLAAGLITPSAHAIAAPTWRVRTDAALGPRGAQAQVVDAFPAGDGSPWVLAGTWQSSADSLPQPTVWTTTVRERLPKWNWKRRSLPLPKRADGGTVAAVTKGTGSTMIAAGTTRSGDDSDAAVWTSSDRTSWKRFDAPAHRQPGLQTLIGVAATKHGFVTVGTDRKGPLVLRGNRKGLSRLSVPGVKDFRGLRSISSDGDKVVLIIGLSGKIGATQPFAYVSRDEGQTWDISDAFPTHSSTEIVGVANLGGTYLGVGSEITPLGPSLMLWRSTDGIRWRRAPNGVVDSDTGDPKDPLYLIPVAVTREGVLALYDQRIHRSLFSYVDSGFTIHTFKVDVAPKAFDIAGGPIVLHNRFAVTVSYGAGRPNVSVFDLDTSSWVSDPDPEHSDSAAFPARSLGRSATIVVQGGKGTRLIGVEGPIRGAASGPPTYRMIAWSGAGTALASPRVLKLPLGTYLQAAVRAKGATYLFGFAPDPRGYSDGVVWRYGDDDKLTAVKTTGLGGLGDQRIFGAAYFDGQWLAVGFTAPDAKGGTDAAVWFSDDGETWELRSTTEMAGDGDQKANAVCTGASGQPIIVGSTTNSGGVDVPVSWYPNNQDWKIVLLSGAKAGQLTSCAGTADGVVAVGPYANDALLWRTADGKKWTSTRLPVQAPAVAQLSNVAASAAGIVTAGWVDDGTGNFDLGVWAVPNGGKPARVPDGAGFRGFGPQQPSGITLRGGRLTIAGSSGSSARLWETPNVFAK